MTSENFEEWSSRTKAGMATAASEPLQLCPPGVSVFKVLATKLGWNRGTAE